MFGAVLGGCLLALCSLSSMSTYFVDRRPYRLGLSRETDTFCLQDPDAELDADERVSVSVEEAQHRAEIAFGEVFENGPKIELDHYIVYYARGSHFLSFRIHAVR